MRWSRGGAEPARSTATPRLVSLTPPPGEPAEASGPPGESASAGCRPRVAGLQLWRPSRTSSACWHEPWGRSGWDEVDWAPSPPAVSGSVDCASRWEGRSELVPGQVTAEDLHGWSTSWSHSAGLVSSGLAQGAGAGKRCGCLAWGPSSPAETVNEFSSGGALRNRPWWVLAGLVSPCGAEVLCVNCSPSGPPAGVATRCFRGDGSG